MTPDMNAIINGFQAFYYELLRQKEKALSFYLTSEIVSPSVDENNFIEKNNENTKENYIPNDELEGTIVTIQKKLIMAIDSVVELISSETHLPTQSIRDIRYVLTVLSDEIFLNLNWEGNERWKLYLLERQLFQTEIAGNKFFEMAEEVITTRNEDMGFLYLMSLNLGFRGKYRDENKADEYIASYKSRLYALVHPLSNRLFYPGRVHLIEQCYEYTYTETCISELPDTKHLATCIISIIIVYIVVSYIVWYDITDDINNLIKQISLQTQQHLVKSYSNLGA